MGFLNNIFKNDKPSENTSKLNLNKEESVRKINLNKENVHAIRLSKDPIKGTKSRTALVLDYSGSMSGLYKDGTVQSIIEMALPIAMEFDDNGSMEMWIFENGYHRLPDITIDNFYGYVEREIVKKYSMGGTNYAPVMKDVFKRYIKQEPAKLPNYVIFITDGDNSDYTETDKAITEMAKYPIFWQFIGVGHSSFNYLQKLDDMEGRYVDNADFFNVSDASQITYAKLLDEYPGWVSDPKVQDMLR